ncbi:MAG: hypothetical protein C0501_15250 [Isosphaera sp.]|nr:hypothetical protein [Isosphaera sp.]
MTREEHNAVNQAAFPALKAVIEANYPPRQFVAIAGGKIVADDADIEKLDGKIRALGIDPMNTLVDRVGEEWSEDELVIL